MLALPAVERVEMGRAERTFVAQTFSEEAVFTAYQQALEELRTRAPDLYSPLRHETVTGNN